MHLGRQLIEASAVRPLQPTTPARQHERVDAQLVDPVRRPPGLAAFDREPRPQRVVRGPPEDVLDVPRRASVAFADIAEQHGVRHASPDELRSGSERQVHGRRPSSNPPIAKNVADRIAPHPVQNVDACSGPL